MAEKGCKKMNKKELIDSIDIILDNENYNMENKIINRLYLNKKKKVFHETSSNEDPLLLNMHPEYTTYKQDRISVVILKNIELYYDNLDLLIKIFDEIKGQPDLQNEFILYLLSKINNRDLVQLSLETLLKLGYFNMVIEKFSYILNSKYQINLLYSAKILDSLLFFEYNLFDIEQLKKIKIIFRHLHDKNKHMTRFKDDLYFTKRVVNRIELLLYEKLKYDLGELSNFQINIDNEKIKGKLIEFEFDPILKDSLEKVDQYFYSIAKDEFDYSMAIGLLREYINKLIENISKKINEKSGIDYPNTEQTPIGNMRKYVKNELKLNHEHHLLNKLIDIINDQGSHSLISDREYFRLTKNISIEVSLLLITKLGKYLNK
jgi:hypothetical protein